MMTDPVPEKLLMVIVGGGDSEKLMTSLVQQRLSVTKMGSSGGFLRRGNTTLLIGVPAARVDEVLSLVRDTCPERTELGTVQPLPLVGGSSGERPREVRTGGAVVFVLDVERFEKV